MEAEGDTEDGRGGGEDDSAAAADQEEEEGGEGEKGLTQEEGPWQK